MTTLLPRPDSLGSARLAASAGAGLRKSHSASVSAPAPAPPSFAMLPSRLRRVTVMVASRDSSQSKHTASSTPWRAPSAHAYDDAGRSPKNRFEEERP